MELMEVYRERSGLLRDLFEINLAKYAIFWDNKLEVNWEEIGNGDDLVLGALCELGVLSGEERRNFSLIERTCGDLNLHLSDKTKLYFTDVRYAREFKSALEEREKELENIRIMEKF